MDNSGEDLPSSRINEPAEGYVKAETPVSRLAAELAIGLSLAVFGVMVSVGTLALARSSPIGGAGILWYGAVFAGLLMAWRGLVQYVRETKNIRMLRRASIKSQLDSASDEELDGLVQFVSRESMKQGGYSSNSISDSLINGGWNPTFIRWAVPKVLKSRGKVDLRKADPN